MSHQLKAHLHVCTGVPSGEEPKNCFGYFQTHTQTYLKHQFTQLQSSTPMFMVSPTASAAVVTAGVLVLTVGCAGCGAALWRVRSI